MDSCTRRAGCPHPAASPVSRPELPPGGSFMAAPAAPATSNFFILTSYFPYTMFSPKLQAPARRVRLEMIAFFKAVCYNIQKKEMIAWPYTNPARNWSTTRWQPPKNRKPRKQGALCGALQGHPRSGLGAVRSGCDRRHPVLFLDRQGRQAVRCGFWESTPATPPPASA